MSLLAMLPLGHHLSNIYFTPLTSLVDSLVSSKYRSPRPRDNNTVPKQFDLETPQYLHDMRLAPRDEPRNFAKTLSSVENSE